MALLARTVAGAFVLDSVSAQIVRQLHHVRTQLIRISGAFAQVSPPSGLDISATCNGVGLDDVQSRAGHIAFTCPDLESANVQE